MFNSPAQIRQYIFKIRYKLIKSFFLLKILKIKKSLRKMLKNSIFFWFFSLSVLWL